LTEPTKIFLGTIDTTGLAGPGAIVLPELDLNEPVETLRERIAKAEAERFEAQKRESVALANMFLPADGKLAEPPEKERP
jgi:hypothetical protein